MRSGRWWRGRWWWRGGAPTTASGCSGSWASRRAPWWSRGAIISSRWKRPMLTINVVTPFAEVSPAPLAASIVGRAAEQGLVRYRVVQLRDYTPDRHKTVDDYPYGGGAGMVLKPEPFFEAVEELRAGPPIVLLSARGRPFGHRDAVRFAVGRRSEEHTSELQSPCNLVCRLLLEKKKKKPHERQRVIV